MIPLVAMTMLMPMPAHAIGRVIISAGPMIGGGFGYPFGGFGGFGYGGGFYPPPMIGPTVVMGPGSGFGPIFLFFLLPIIF